MNAELLRTFIEVSKTRHFGRAAENLCLTQSAVSFRIKQLEDSIGTPLFFRLRNNIQLTVAGERFLPHAENILAAWQSALQDVAVAESRDTQITLGSTSNLWDTFLHSILPKVAARHEDICIRTEINSHQELTRALLTGRIDLVVLLDPPKVAELVLEKIGRIELLLVSDSCEVDIDSLAQRDHIFVDWGTAMNFQQAKLFSTPVAPVLHTGQSQIALEFLLANGGFVFLPKVLVQPYLDQGRLFVVKGMESVVRDVFAVYSAESTRKETITPIINMVKEIELKPASG